MSKKTKNKEFSKLFEEVKQVRKRYLITLAFHKIFQNFNKLAAPNIVGKKKAERNVKIFGNYLYFFMTKRSGSVLFFN